MVRTLFVTFILELLIIHTVSAQDSLSKAGIIEKMEVFRNCKKEIRRHLIGDSVYFLASCRSFSENNYIEFSRLGKNKDGRHNWVICQFYFLNDNLIFIVQRTRNRKHYSEYYLRQGKIFSTELDNTLPVLSQDIIDQLKTRLLTIRNSSPQ